MSLHQPRTHPPSPRSWPGCGCPSRSAGPRTTPEPSWPTRPILPRSGSTSAGAGSGQALAYHLHGLTRSTIRSADGATDARWTDHDWQNAVETPPDRPRHPVDRRRIHRPPTGSCWSAACTKPSHSPAPSDSTSAGSPTPAWVYVSDSVGAPIAPPARPGSEHDLQTPADALVELPRRARPPPARVPLRRRRPPHRPSPAVGCYRPTSTGCGIYLAKAHRDLGDSAASRQGLQDRHGRRRASRAGRCSPRRPDPPAPPRARPRFTPGAPLHYVVAAAVVRAVADSIAA
ncbi:hypothetical protein LT493_24480 [Streptomyces tricolor]|nr:hypothetical protein [Streptomyces tricolor]